MAIREIVPWRWGGLRRTHSDPWGPGSMRRQMDALHQEIDRMFDDFMFARPERAWLPRFWGRDQMLPDIDEYEDEKAFYITVELPGLDEKDVDVSLKGRRLTIRGEKKQEEEKKEKDWYRRERMFGSFRRSIELPSEIQIDGIEASFDKGVLSMTLPKTKEAQEKIKHIEVKAA